MASPRARGMYAHVTLHGATFSSLPPAVKNELVVLQSESFGFVKASTPAVARHGIPRPGAVSTLPLAAGHAFDLHDYVMAEWKGKDGKPYWKLELGGSPREGDGFHIRPFTRVLVAATVGGGAALWLEPMKTGDGLPPRCTPSPKTYGGAVDATDIPTAERQRWNDDPSYRTLETLSRWGQVAAARELFQESCVLLPNAAEALHLLGAFYEPFDNRRENPPRPYPTRTLQLVYWLRLEPQPLVVTARAPAQGARPSTRAYPQGDGGEWPRCLWDAMGAAFRSRARHRATSAPEYLEFDAAYRAEVADRGLGSGKCYEILFTALQRQLGGGPSGGAGAARLPLTAAALRTGTALARCAAPPQLTTTTGASATVTSSITLRSVGGSGATSAPPVRPAARVAPVSWLVAAAAASGGSHRGAASATELSGAIAQLSLVGEPLTQPRAPGSTSDSTKPTGEQSAAAAAVESDFGGGWEVASTARRGGGACSRRG